MSVVGWRTAIKREVGRNGARSDRIEDGERPARIDASWCGPMPLTYFTPSFIWVPDVREVATATFPEGSHFGNLLERGQAIRLSFLMLLYFDISLELADSRVCVDNNYQRAFSRPPLPLASSVPIAPFSLSLSHPLYISVSISISVSLPYPWPSSCLPLPVSV